MIHTAKIKTDLRSRAVLPGNFEQTLVVCMKSPLERYTNQVIPWHWHDTFEVGYLLQGEMQLSSADVTLNLKQGDIYFVNQSVMHEYRGNTDNPCVFTTILFDMHLLSGLYNSGIEQKYILPMKENGPEICSFSPDSNERLAMAQSYLNAVELLRTEPFGYEMQVRSELSSLWLKLISESKDRIVDAAKTGRIDKERMKKMLEYIHVSYAEKITIESVASAANISVRECNRCFARCIEKPPVKYLTEYRLHKAAEMLRETDSSVLDVSEACGFSSSSYFGKMFSEYMGCTPKEYRRMGSDSGKTAAK